MVTFAIVFMSIWAYAVSAAYHFQHDNHETWKNVSQAYYYVQNLSASQKIKH